MMGKIKELHYNMQEILKEYKENVRTRDDALFSLWQLGLSSEEASDFLRRGHFLRDTEDNKKGDQKRSPNSFRLDVC